jgi:hypothetical protein
MMTGLWRGRGYSPDALWQSSSQMSKSGGSLGPDG